MQQRQQLTPIQSKAIARLLAGQSVAAVARELGVDRSTIYDWRATRPYFRLALEQGRARLQEIAFDALQDLAGSAIETLRDLLTNPTVPPTVRLRAVESVLRAVRVDRPPVLEPQAAPLDPPPPPPPADERPSTEQAQPPTPPEPRPGTAAAPQRKAGRNEPCPCGSSKKFKRCCGSGSIPGAPIPHNPTASGIPALETCETA